jgi:pimeloyl-ACP methyl ester carboxylesterase
VRSVLPRLAPRFRCVALDLIGMGQSSNVVVAWYRAHLPNLTAIDLGPGIHVLPEDHLGVTGDGIATWLDRIADLPGLG